MICIYVYNIYRYRYIYMYMYVCTHTGMNAYVHACVRTRSTCARTCMDAHIHWCDQHTLETSQGRQGTLPHKQKQSQSDTLCTRAPEGDLRGSATAKKRNGDRIPTVNNTCYIHAYVHTAYPYLHVSVKGSGRVGVLMKRDSGGGKKRIVQRRAGGGR